MTKLASLPTIAQVIIRDKLRAHHKLGQHFLTDTTLLGQIAEAAKPLLDDNIIEIGPGPGGLTRALLENGAQNLFIIERDHRFIPALKEIQNACNAQNLIIIAEDALSIKLTDIAPAPYRIVANLPYNIATSLIIEWLKLGSEIKTMVLMVQKEVGMRLCAKVGDTNYGRLSIIAAFLAQCEILFSVSPDAFIPPPKVESVVIRLTPHHAKINIDQLAKLEKIIAAGFGNRRKMLRKSLLNFSPQCEALLSKANIDGTRRAESLSLSEFLTLCDIA